jgi:unconventional prefoldin RPB5 interactor 1
MAASPEQLSKSLEERLEKLQKTLRYWQVWEAEHEACKEEIGELDDDATADQMVRLFKYLCSH